MREFGPSGERDEWILQPDDQTSQFSVIPDVCPAGSCARIAAEDRADVVILKPGREHVGRAVAEGVGDEDDRPLVYLLDVIALLRVCQGKAL